MLSNKLFLIFVITGIVITFTTWKLSKKWRNASDSSQQKADTRISLIKELTPENARSFITSMLPSIVIVDFFAEWCGPCKTIAPILEDLAYEFKDRYIFVKINIDTCPDIAKEYGIVSIPTIAIMSNGVILDKIVGLTSKENLKEAIALAIKGPQDLSLLDQQSLNNKLHRALQNNEPVEEIKRILDADADVNAPGPSGLSPLAMVTMLGAMKGIDCVDIAQLLLDRGASPEIIDPKTGKAEKLVNSLIAMEQQYEKIIANIRKLIPVFTENEKKSHNT